MKIKGYCVVVGRQKLVSGSWDDVPLWKWDAVEKFFSQESEAREYYDKQHTAENVAFIALYTAVAVMDKKGISEWTLIDQLDVKG